MPAPKHTPGPWIMFRDRGVPAAILPAGRDGEICQFASAYTSEANARLIAAAPELYEMLRQALGFAAVSYGRNVDSGNNATAERIMNFINRCEDLMTKVEGK